MDYKFSQNLILLTYKGKALLMHKQKGVLDPEEHPWSFIDAINEKGETLEKAMKRRVQKEMGIKIENIEFLSNCYFHANLTDDNVNNIKRSEHQLLDFYSLKEIKKLFLSDSTSQFIFKYGSLIENS